MSLVPLRRMLKARSARTSLSGFIWRLDRRDDVTAGIEQRHGAVRVADHGGVVLAVLVAKVALLPSESVTVPRGSALVVQLDGLGMVELLCLRHGGSREHECEDEASSLFLRG